MSLAGRGYLLAAAVVLLGIITQWWDAAPPALWRVLAAALLLSLLLEAYLAHRGTPRLERRVPQTARLGRPIQVALVAHGPADRPLILETEDLYPLGLRGPQGPVAWSAPIAPTATQRLTLTPQRLGVLEWELLYVRWRGPLGLAWWSRRLRLPSRIRVIPDALDDRERRSGVVAGGDLSRAAAGSGRELLSLRPYTWQDPLHAIDWKATARSQRTTVRVYADEQHMELMLLIDAGRSSGLQAGPLSRLHHHVNVAARLAEKSVRSGDSVGLVVYAEGPIEIAAPAKGARGLARLRQALERVRTQSGESNPLAAVLQMRQWLRQRSLVVILTDLEEGDAATQLLRATELLAGKHLPLVAGLLDEEVLALEHAEATDWLDPYRSLAARDALHGMRRIAARLQRLGASVVLARPAQLDQAVLSYYERLRYRRRV